MANKFKEREYVDSANKFIGNIWTCIMSREEPDFEAMRDDLEIGIEVTNIFSRDSKKGSPDKKRESSGEKNLRKLAQEYYSERKSPINVQVLGWSRSGSAYDRVLDLLLNRTLSGNFKPTRYELANGVTVYVRDLPVSDSKFSSYSRWKSVDNHIGYPREVTVQKIQRAIDKKKKKLPEYLKSYAHVDLLIVADRTYESGMLLPSDSIEITNPGFTNIYFMSYPESLMCLTR